jgi:hypothetical protein
MGSGVSFMRDRVFYPETIDVMARAYPAAKQFLPANNPEIHETLAVRIVNLATFGERDPNKLAAEALAPFVAAP